MKELSDEEKAIIKRCREICNNNDAEQSEALIKLEYPGCSVDVDMVYGNISLSGPSKSFQGMMLYKTFNIFF